ncbi:MAG: LuxR C-terminal-related transcriptional regulator [Chloroflexota bacterium]
MGEPLRPSVYARQGDDSLAALPSVRDILIGREWELSAATERILAARVGLLTLTGVGGSGKTRLALRLAADLQGHFEDGVAFVPLAPVRDPGLVASAMVQALGIRDAGGRSPDQLLRAHLRDRHLLLVLDNFEHVVVAAQLVADLLASCPRLQVLVTSRAVLRVRGEHDLPVPPLSLPSGQTLPSAAGVAQSPAVRLFVERARMARAGFTLTDDNAVMVSEICRRLDGLPLAIELAAARLRHLTPVTLLARLERRLPLLTGGARDLPARQQTLRNTIDWSYDLLDGDEQALFRNLAVFTGGCTLEAAEAICAEGEADRAGVLGGLASLVDHSLIGPEAIDGLPRFRMLETIREYAQEKLVESAEEDETRHRHAAYFARFAQDADFELRGAGQCAWLARLEADHDNLRAALAWNLSDVSRSEAALQLAGALGRFWNIRGHITEGSRWLREALAMDDPATSPAVRAYALLRAGSLANWGGEATRAEDLLREGLALYEAVGDGVGMARALSTLGLVALACGDRACAVALSEESVERARTAGDDYGAGYSLINLARARLESGDLMGAQRDAGEGTALCRAAGDNWAVAVGLSRLGVIMHLQGDMGRARTLSWEAIRICRDVGDPRIMAVALQTVGRTARATGDSAVAARLFGCVEALRNRAGAPLYPAEHADFEREVEALRQSLGHAAFENAWNEGRALSAEQAADYALEGVGPADQLTPRERQVAAMIGQGYTNRRIAEELVIAEKTAEVHARNIREKLGLPTRAGVAAWAARSGLVPADEGGSRGLQPSAGRTP